MESNTSSHQSGSIAIDSNLISEFDNSVSDDLVNPSKIIDSSTSSISSSLSSSDDDDDGFVSGGEEFETASEKPIIAGETLEDEILEDDDDVAAFPAFVAMPVAIVTEEDEDEEDRVLSSDEVAERETAIEPVSKFEEEDEEARVLGGGEVVEREAVIEPVSELGENGDETSGVLTGSEVVERETAIESVLNSGEIGDETSGVRVLGSNEAVEREEDAIEPVPKFGEIGEETSEIVVLGGDEVVEREAEIELVSKLGEIEEETSGVRVLGGGEVVEREEDAIEPVPKLIENGVVGSVSGSVETEPVSVENSNLGVVGDENGGNVELVQSENSNSGVIQDEAIEVFAESEITKSEINEGLENEIPKTEVKAEEGIEVAKTAVEERENSFESMEMSHVSDENPKVEALEQENLEVAQETGEEGGIDIVNAVEIKEKEMDNNGSIETSLVLDNASNHDDDENFGSNQIIPVENIKFPTQENAEEPDLEDTEEFENADSDEEQTDNADSDDEQTDGVVFGSSQAAKQFMEELERETASGPLEIADSEEETDSMVFGSSQAARHFMEDLEREQQASGSHEIDGQIVTDDSEEEAENDGEDEKEVFDAAAFAALLKAATRGGDDGGNITINSQDGSRLFSIERPAGLGSSNRVAQPMGRVNRSALFAPPSVGVEKELSEEEKKKLESLQNLRVKFLRLVRRLGASPEDSVAAQVLYRLAIVAGRPNHPAFSFDDAKTTALELEAEGKDDLDFSINILVLGKCGVGKSSTINSIFGEEKAKVGSFELGTTSVREISGIVDGVKIKVIDTPGLKSSLMEQSFNRKILSSVKSFTKKSPPDIVLYIDRLDTQTRDLNDLPLLKTITTALGQPIWRSAVVALSHAASAPPDGPNGNPLNYEVSVTQRSHVVQQSIGHAVGDLRMMSPSLMNPVTLVENHHLCRKNRDGHKVLPNGQTWRPQLLLLCYSMKILALANSISKPQDPFDHRKIFGFRVRSPPLPYLLSSMLQSRAHPKLPSDQGMDNGDSDVDMADFSDSDNEEDEDEYDQLPSFKPLRKAQIEKLSKEQRKAYFEEFDYRLKLLQKKQWRDEVKRVKEMKRREKGGGGGPEYGFNEADQEADGPAPVATPMPDMAMPPTFDSDNPTYRYRFLETTSQLLTRPVLDAHSWDHDCGYDGVNLEQSLAIANKFPAAVSVQGTKDKKDFSFHLDSSIAAKYGENCSAMAGFDIQNVGKQRAYIIRGETKFKNLKKNKTAAGVTVTFLGENIATGLKIEDQIAIGKQWAMSGSAGTVMCQGDAAYGANLEVQRRERDYPIGQVQSTYGLSLIRWRGDWALGFNSVAQFAIGRNSKVAVRAGINNKLSGQITARTSSSDHLSLVLVGIIPIASAIYKKIWPAAGDNYSIY